MINLKKVILSYPEPVVIKDEVFTARNQEPKIKEVVSHGKPIVAYPIEEAQFDPDGNTIEQVDPPYYKTTGRSLEWSIAPGESLAFPEYVANVLVKRYGFLEIKDEKLVETPEMAPTATEEFKTATEAKSVESNVACKYCGKQFRNKRGLGLHLGHQHLDKIL